MRKFTKGLLYSLIGIFGTTAVASGSYILLTKFNEDTTQYEAVVINDDTSFSKAVDYSAVIVPGGYAVQDFKISSQVSMSVEYEFSFYTEEENNYYPITVTIARNDEVINEDNLNTLLVTNKSFKYVIDNKQTDYIKITYALDFNYMGKGTEWNFSINFLAKGSYSI